MSFHFHSPDADALQMTCEKTGGRFIESSKVDVDDIVALLSQSIKSSEVRLSSIVFYLLYLIFVSVSDLLTNWNNRENQHSHLC